MRSALVVLLVIACRNEPADRDASFHVRRDARIAELEAEHAAIAAEPRIIAVFAEVMPLTEAGRAELDGRLHVVQVRLDETANLIEALRHTEADLWKPREARVSAAMHHLDDARGSAWQALATP